MRVAVAALLFAFLGQSVFARVEDGRRATPSAAAPASNSTAPANSSPAALKADVLVAAVPDAPLLPTAAKTVEPEPSAISTTGPTLGNEFLVNNSLAPIHALFLPPTAVIKLKPQPSRSHSFFDARNRLGFATLGASLTADALSTQKGLAYPGFHEMNPIARPFVQTRVGAAAYNAGSFGLMAGIMYWAHKKEHHKLERILPLAVGGWEGLLSFRNYRVIANRPR
ncbi:MAG TPA: hypothetical protein VGR76_04835 [Candidatus Angelobacter sp.]|nr:hypothetical protein [Candidatus Angelobacter sp.]